MKKDRKSGFTMVEILTVLAIVALLVGVLLPTLSAVRTSAKQTKQKVQLTTIDLALTAFKNDYGDYPPSDGPMAPPFSVDYRGAQKLAEALLGWDLMGFHPKSIWDAPGTEYDPPDPNDRNLDERRGPYLELATANAFRLGVVTGEHDGLFNDCGPYSAPDTFVLCDVFGVRRITLANGSIVKAGTPILYYKAEPSKKSMNAIDPGAPGYSTNFIDHIYNAFDNLVLIYLDKLTPDGQPGKEHKLIKDKDGGDTGIAGTYFYNRGYKIIDPKVTARLWPYRPDSYILISAGVDGEYGTADDITNF